MSGGGWPFAKAMRGSLDQFPTWHGISQLRRPRARRLAKTAVDVDADIPIYRQATAE